MKNSFETSFKDDPVKSEYYLPAAADKLVKEGKARVKVIVSRDKWYGVTYKEDKEDVQNALQAMKRQRRDFILINCGNKYNDPSFWIIPDLKERVFYCAFELKMTCTPQNMTGIREYLNRAWCRRL